MAFCISLDMTIVGSIPIEAACSKKNDEGAIPDEELGSVMSIRPSFVRKPSMRPYDLNPNAR